MGPVVKTGSILRVRFARPPRQAGAGSPSVRARRRRALGLTGRFTLVLVALVLVLGGLGWAGLAGLSSVRGSLERIYQGNVTDQQTVTNVSGRLDDVEELILRGWVTTDQRPREQLAAELDSASCPMSSSESSRSYERPLTIQPKRPSRRTSPRAGPRSRRCGRRVSGDPGPPAVGPPTPRRSSLRWMRSTRTPTRSPGWRTSKARDDTKQL
jgi:hypothetical protein